MTTPHSTDRDESTTDPARWSVSRWWAPPLGLVVVAVAFAVTELLAAVGVWIRWLSPASSPLQSLANTFITLTPEWLKHWAIVHFGTNDKLALGAGMLTTIAVAALVLGVIARRSRRVAAGLLLVLAVVAAVAILTRVNTDVLDLLPLLIGSAVGVLSLRLLFPATDAPAARTHDATTGPEPVGTVPGPVGRRVFFRRLGLVAIAATAAGVVAKLVPTGATARASRAAVLLPGPAKATPVPAGADHAVPGQTALVTANKDFYRIDTSFDPPEIAVEDWSLTITGMVEQPMSLNYQQLSSRPQIELPITMTCVSNEVGGDLAGNALWLGCRIDDLLAEVKPQAGADCVLCTDVNGFTISAPLEALTDGRDALLAIGMNGEPLPIEHGFPVRMVVPGLYGYVSATKWIVSMELTKFADVAAYWTKRGWSDHGPIKTAARIDTPASFANLTPGTVTVAGVAWAQHRGIEKVEVQVDDGPWTTAELSKPLSVDTWVQWKFPWKADQSGLHTLRVRAVDSNGDLQIEERAGTIPNGSSGWHSRQVSVG